MFEKIKSLREEREEGFTLIELLVVILIIGILSAIAIPAFLNQRKSAVDSSVQSDVSNAAKQIENWITKQGSTSKPLPSLETLDIKKSDGVTLVVAGSSTGYCVTGTNPGGDVSATDGYVWASNAGGMSTQGKACEAGYLTDNAVVVPPAGTGSEETPTAGTVYSGTMYSNGSETVNFTYTASRATNGTWSFNNITISGDDTTGQLDMIVNDPANPYDPDMGPMGASLTITDGTGSGTSVGAGPDATFTASTFTTNNGLQYYYYG